MNASVESRAHEIDAAKAGRVPVRKIRAMIFGLPAIEALPWRGNSWSSWRDVRWNWQIGLLQQAATGGIVRSPIAE